MLIRSRNGRRFTLVVPSNQLQRTARHLTRIVTLLDDLKEMALLCHRLFTADIGLMSRGSFGRVLPLAFSSQCSHSTR